MINNRVVSPGGAVTKTGFVNPKATRTALKPETACAQILLEHTARIQMPKQIHLVCFIPSPLILILSGKSHFHHSNARYLPSA
jgi:hypothetical protein